MVRVDPNAKNDGYNSRIRIEGKEVNVRLKTAPRERRGKESMRKGGVVVILFEGSREIDECWKRKERTEATTQMHTLCCTSQLDQQRRKGRF